MEKQKSTWEKEKIELLKELFQAQNKEVNVLITGATGSGKSSTINALFDYEISKVGYGVDPETMNIEKFKLDNLILWDSPGLGDGIKADIRHSKNIINKLIEKDENGEALIDIVLVIIDGSSRDMGTSYQLINEVIIPNMKDKKRILVAINQCDIAMKGKKWNHNLKTPETELFDFLDDKVKSVEKRIFESTNVEIKPIFYSASEFYNISKLLHFLIKYTPKEKRAIYINNVNTNRKIWQHNDELEDYNTEIKKDLIESIQEGVEKGKMIGGEIGGIFGTVGRKIGGAIGGTIGGLIGAAKKFLGGIFS